MAERQGRLLLPMFALSIYYYTKDTTGMNIFEREYYVGILYGTMFACYEWGICHWVRAKNEMLFGMGRVFVQIMKCLPTPAIIGNGCASAASTMYILCFRKRPFSYFTIWTIKRSRRSVTLLLLLLAPPPPAISHILPSFHLLHIRTWLAFTAGNITVPNPILFPLLHWLPMSPHTVCFSFSPCE